MPAFTAYTRLQRPKLEAQLATFGKLWPEFLSPIPTIPSGRSILNSVIFCNYSGLSFHTFTLYCLRQSENIGMLVGLVTARS